MYRHLVRAVADDGYRLLALQWPAERRLKAEWMREWDDGGVRLIAVSNGNGAATTPQLPVVELAGQAGLLIGPREMIEAIATELDGTP